ISVLRKWQEQAQTIRSALQNLAATASIYSAVGSANLVRTEETISKMRELLPFYEQMAQKLSSIARELSSLPITHPKGGKPGQLCSSPTATKQHGKTLSSTQMTSDVWLTLVPRAPKTS